MNKLFLIFCVLTTGVIAQNDSLTIKLKRLKALKDSSLITQSEYDQLRLKELNLKPKSEKITVANSETIIKLKSKIRGKIIGASFGAVLGGFGIAGMNYFNGKAIVYKYDYKGNIDQADYEKQLDAKKTNVTAFGIFTGFMGVFTLVNLVTLPSAIDNYKRAKQTVSLNINSKGLSIAYKF